MNLNRRTALKAFGTALAARAVGGQATATGALDGVDPDRTDELPERHVAGRLLPTRRGARTLDGGSGRSAGHSELSHNP